MKIKANRETPKFTPITITITIESKDEFLAIRRLSQLNETIPEIAEKNGGNFKITQDFLSGLFDNLCAY